MSGLDARHFRHEELEYDVVVCGGGLAGVCAAIAAARGGSRVGLIQDRTVLGGNSSSEVRVTPHGAAQFHAYARETGIISELLIEERAQNHAEIMENGWTNSVWDLVLLTAVLKEQNIELHLNTKVMAADTTDRDIAAVTAFVLDAETELRIRGRVFVDATGDGLVAHSAGCESMFGTEGTDVWDEPHAMAESSADTMGNSLHFKTEDVGRPVDWQPPTWAKDLSDRSFFYDQGRVPWDPRGGFWWIELGSPQHTIYDNRTIRADLQQYVLGIWDWMKNKDPQMRDATANRALDWMGSVLGKRESRRIVGRIVVTEQEIQARRAWTDEVAFGGWFLDLHTAGGLIAEHSEANSADNYNPFTERAALGYVGPYGIPLSALIARDVDNLFLAGRNISASHAALGTMRVMATTALMGQAVGTAAADCVNAGHVPGDLAEDSEAARASVARIRLRLAREGVWLPSGVESDPDDLAPSASVTASSEDLVRGLHPDALGYAEEHELIDRRFKPEFLDRVDSRMAQPIATDGSLRAVSLFVTNHADADTTASLSMFLCDGIHDYTIYDEENALAAATVPVLAGHSGWLEWELPATVAELVESSPGASTSIDPPSYVRLELAKNPDLQWHQSQTCLPAHPAIYEVALWRMRRLQEGVSLGFSVSPPQRAYPASAVTSGVTRPHDRPHLWRSDPAQPLPAHIDLTWDAPVTVSSVELTFAGNLLREYHAYRPYFRGPQTARDYTVLAREGDRWRPVASEMGNYQRRRVHALQAPVSTDSLRVRIDATNGDAAAALYEIRVY